MRTAALWTLGLVASWMLVGCAGGGGASPSDAGLDGSDDAGDGSPDASDCGGLAWGSASCASCTHASCCSLEMLCAAIPTCAPLDACWNACGADAGCTNGCGAAYSQAISNYSAILNCQSDSCAAACTPSE
jgi:hypothetical protein